MLRDGSITPRDLIGKLDMLRQLCVIIASAVIILAGCDRKPTDKVNACGDGSWHATINIDPADELTAAASARSTNQVGPVERAACLVMTFACNRKRLARFQLVLEGEKSPLATEFGAPVTVSGALVQGRFKLDPPSRIYRLDDRTSIELLIQIIADSGGLFSVPITFDGADPATAEFGDWGFEMAIRPVLVACRLRNIPLTPSPVAEEVPEP